MYCIICVGKKVLLDHIDQSISKQVCKIKLVARSSKPRKSLYEVLLDDRKKLVREGDLSNKSSLMKL